MNVSVLLFAEARVSIGSPSILISLDPGATVGQLRMEIGRQFPKLRSLLERSSVAVNQKFSDDATRLNERDEIAWIPPVSGG